MAKFSELGVESDVIVGKGIDIEELFGRRILIEKTIIQPTKFPVLFQWFGYIDWRNSKSRNQYANNQQTTSRKRT